MNIYEYIPLSNLIYIYYIYICIYILYILYIYIYICIYIYTIYIYIYLSKLIRTMVTLVSNSCDLFQLALLVETAYTIVSMI